MVWWIIHFGMGLWCMRGTGVGELLRVKWIWGETCMRMGWKSVDKVQPGGSSSLDLFARSSVFRLTATLLNNMLWVALAHVSVCVPHLLLCVKVSDYPAIHDFPHSHRIPWTEGSAVRWAEAELRQFSGVTSRRSCIGAREHLRKRDTKGRGTQGTWGTPKDTKVKISAQALVCLLSWQAADCGFIHTYTNN